MCQEGGRGPEGGRASEHGENQTVGFCSVDPSNVTAPWQRLRYIQDISSVRPQSPEEAVCVRMCVCD